MSVRVKREWLVYHTDWAHLAERLNSLTNDGEYNIYGIYHSGEHDCLNYIVVASKVTGIEWEKGSVK